MIILSITILLVTDVITSITAAFDITLAVLPSIAPT